MRRVRTSSHKYLPIRISRVMAAKTEQNWNLCEELGGVERLEEMMRVFYERVFADMMIGFMFVGVDIDEIVASQVQYMRARLGNEKVRYEGKPIRAGHKPFPILISHFNRRHQMLKDVLREFDVPEHVFDAWVELELSLRALVVRTGAEARDKILNPPGDD